MQGRFRGFEVTTTADGIATLTMNEPEHLNGTTQPMKRDMTEVFTQLQMDDSVRVVVVTGTGRAFCAGDDMTGRRRAWDDVDKLVPTLPPGHQDPIGTYEGLRTMSQSLNLAVRALDKPTIAAVNGIAIQTGLSLVHAFDDIAARTAVTDHHPDVREGVAAFREKRKPKFAP